MMKLSLRYLLATLSCMMMSSMVYAAGTVGVNVGNNATINWNVSTGGNCTTDTNYPGVADGVRGAWVDGLPRSLSGSQIFTGVSQAGTWTFSCNAAGYGCSPASTCDSTILIVCGSGTTWNGSSCVVSSCGNGANNPPTCNTCTLPLVWNGASCTTPPPTIPVVAVSGTTAYNDGSAKARMGYYGETSSARITWTVTGSPAVNCNLYHDGVLDGAISSTGGTYALSSSQPITSYTIYTVMCGNAAGVGQDAMSFTVPPVPTGMTTSCPAPGTTGTMSWTAPSGYNTFYTRASLGGVLEPAPATDEAFVGTSKSFPTQAGQTYSTWIHSRAANGSYSNAVSANMVCGVPGPSPTASFTSTPSCTIAINGSNCNSPVSWTSANLAQVTLTDCGGGVYITTGPGAQTSPVFLPGAGTFCYQIRNTANNVPFDSINGTATCASGSAWNGSSCAVTSCANGTNNPPTCNTCNSGYSFNGTSCVVIPVSGTVGSGTGSCTIASGASSCSIVFTWSTSGASSPNLTNTTTGTTYSTAVSGSTSYTITNGANTVTVRDGTTVLNSVTVTGGCIAGTVWNGSTCAVTSTPSGNLTTPGSCSIASGASTCTVVASWSTANTSAPNLLDANTNTTLSNSANSAGLTVWVGQGGTNFKLRDGATVLDTSFVNGVCTAGTSWNGSSCAVTSCANGTNNPPTCTTCNSGYSFNGTSCVAIPASGTVGSGVGSCTIASGASSCSVVFTWSTSNSSSPNLTNTTTGTTYSTAASGNTSYTITNGSNIVTVRDGTTVLNSVTVTGGCVSGTIWNGSSCQAPSGSISSVSGPGCTIAAGASTCPVTFSWSSSGSTNPNVTNTTTGTTYSTTASGNTSYAITNGANTVALRDSSTVLSSVVVTGGCISGTFWSGGICQYIAPAISASFTPTTVNAGTNYSLTWTATNATTVTASCSGQGKSVFEAVSFTPASGATKTGATTNAMHDLTTCTLTATGPGGTAVSAPFSITINPVCPANAPWDGNNCVNPLPTLSLAPSTPTTILIGTPVTYTVTSNDVGPDLTEASLNWMAPGQPKWNWENSSFGATVTPSAGHSPFAATNAHIDIFTFTPTVPGTYKIYAAVLDNGGTRWTQTPPTAPLPVPYYTLIVTCPVGYLNIGNVCVNPPPSVSISPTGTVTIPVGTPLTLTSLATDASGDIVYHNLTWIKPNGQTRYAVPTAQGGTVTYTPVGGDTIPAGTGNSSIQAVFIPTEVGYYTVQFAAQDNTFAHYGATLVDRWTYSANLTVAVVNGTTATIVPDPANASRINWACFNSDTATMVSTGTSDHSNDFTNKLLPPSSGSFPAVTGATYTLTCKNTPTGQTSTIAYAQPTLTPSGITTTSVTMAYNCNNAGAQSSTLERTPGTSAISNTTSGSQTDTGLAGGTEYTYTLRCFSGLNGTGTQVGATTVRVTTVVASPPQFIIQAYIHRASTDTSTLSSTDPIYADTPDGQFYEWQYKIVSTGGIAATCTMEQRNDNGAWYGGYSSDTTGYTLPWSSLTATDKAAFPTSFSSTHYWRLTCSDNVGRSTSRTWELRKSTVFPTVVDATLNTNCTPAPAPTITVQCANADYYEVSNNITGTPLAGGFGPGTGAVVHLPNADATYRVTCKQGGAAGIPNAGQFLRTYATTMCTTQSISLTATPRTLKAGSMTTLQWSIGNPTASCSLTASSTCTGGSCVAQHNLAVAELNTTLQTSTTDANDPNNNKDSVLGVILRRIQSLVPLEAATSAIQSDAFNNGVPGKALGKKSVKVNHTTDFMIGCGISTSTVRVQVTNDIEG